MHLRRAIVSTEQGQHVCTATQHFHAPFVAAAGQLLAPSPAPQQLFLADLRLFPAVPYCLGPTTGPARTRRGPPRGAQRPAHHIPTKSNANMGRRIVGVPGCRLALVSNAHAGHGTSSAAALHSWERDKSGRSRTPSSASSSAFSQWPICAHSTDRLPSIVALSSGLQADLRPVV